MLYGLRCIGKGAEGGKLLCAILNLPRPNTALTRLVKESVFEVAAMSMNKATEEAVEQNGGSKDLTVVYDGIWQKRGYKSTN